MSQLKKFLLGLPVFSGNHFELARYLTAESQKRTVIVSLLKWTDMIQALVFPPHYKKLQNVDVFYIKNFFLNFIFTLKTKTSNSALKPTHLLIETLCSFAVMMRRGQKKHSGIFFLTSSHRFHRPLQYKLRYLVKDLPPISMVSKINAERNSYDVMSLLRKSAAFFCFIGKDIKNGYEIAGFIKKYDLRICVYLENHEMKNIVKY